MSINQKEFINTLNENRFYNKTKRKVFKSDDISKLERHEWNKFHRNIDINNRDEGKCTLNSDWNDIIRYIRNEVRCTRCRSLVVIFKTLPVIFDFLAFVLFCFTQYLSIFVYALIKDV